MKWVIGILLVGCGGPEFTLLDLPHDQIRSDAASGDDSDAGADAAEASSGDAGDAGDAAGDAALGVEACAPVVAPYPCIASPTVIQTPGYFGGSPSGNNCAPMPTPAPCLCDFTCACLHRYFSPAPTGICGGRAWLSCEESAGYAPTVFCR